MKPINPFRQQGFSLIELMIAITISLLITVAILQLFLDISRTNNELAKTNLQIENGRFAIQVLQRDLMHAGFWNSHIPAFDDAGVNGGGLPPVAAPAPCANFTAADAEALLAMPAQSYSGAPAGCNGISDLSARSDVLVTRHAATQATAPADAVANTVYLQVSHCIDDAVTHSLATSGFVLREKNCSTPSELRDFETNIYYVRGGDVPALMLIGRDGGGFASPQVLIEGIEAFQIELGIDDVNAVLGEPVDYSAGVRGDGAPDRYVRCGATGCDVDDLVNAVSAKIYLLVRNIEPTPGYTDTKTYQFGNSAVGPFNDQFKRHAFISSVRFNNVSGRREIPVPELTP